MPWSTPFDEPIALRGGGKLTTLQHAKGALAAFLLIAAAWMIVSGYTSINAVVKAELSPTKIRAIGVGLPYALTVSIFGGTVDSVALWFKSLGHEDCSITTSPA